MGDRESYALLGLIYWFIFLFHFRIPVSTRGNASTYEKHITYNDDDEYDDDTDDASDNGEDNDNNNYNNKYNNKQHSELRNWG